jgi:hypothetical protein
VPPSRRAISPLPPLYAPWTASVCGGPIPQETLATCDRCAMVHREGGEASRHGSFFDPVSVCCTFFPALPNFLVGRVLADRSLRATPVHRMVRERRVAEALVTPLGISPPPKYRLVYSHNLLGFGNDPGLRCPCLTQTGSKDSPRCAIWRHRQSTCTTWFCKFSRGAVGRNFWQALRDLLHSVEHCLTWWCVLQLGFPADALKRLASFEADRPVLAGAACRGRLDRDLGGDDYDGCWGPWKGREASFYKAAGRLVAGLTWAQVVRIGGPEIALRARLSQEAYQDLVSDDTPERLRLGDFRVLAIGRERSRVVGYSHFDPIEVPNALLRVLHAFDGRATARAVAAIAEEERLELTPGLVRKLVDHGILEQAEVSAPLRAPGRALGRPLTRRDRSRR